MGVAGTVVRNSMAGIGAQLAIKVLSFGFSVLVVRQLGAEQFGQYAAVLAFGATFVFVADLGLGVYTVRDVSRLRSVPDALVRIGALFGNILLLRLVLGAGTAVLLVLSAVATDRPPGMIVGIALGGLGLLIFSVQGACESVLAGYERFDISALAKVANQLVFVLLGAAALILGVGYHGLVAAAVLGAVAMAMICWRGVRSLGVEPSRASPPAWPTLLRASAPFAVIAGTLGLSYKLDSVILNVTRGDLETGYYSAAYNLVFTAAFLSNAVNVALYPTLTRQAVEAPESLPSIYARVLRYLMVLSLPIAFGGWALSNGIIALLFGAGYEPSAPALRILIWVVPLMFASELMGYIVVVRGAEKEVARAVVVSTAISVVCNLLLIPRFGLLGAAVMTVVTEAILVSQYVWHLRAVLADFAWGRCLLLPLLAAVLMGGLALALRDVPILVTIPVAGVVYGGLLFAFGVIGRDELHFLRAPRSPSGRPADAAMLAG
jgi:O-antigen/teichoic acid export membrane protein